MIYHLLMVEIKLEIPITFSNPEKALLPTLITLFTEITDYFGRSDMKFNLNEFNILNGMMTDIEYSGPKCTCPLTYCKDSDNNLYDRDASGEFFTFDYTCTNNNQCESDLTCYPELTSPFITLITSCGTNNTFCDEFFHSGFGYEDGTYNINNCLDGCLYHEGSNFIGYTTLLEKLQPGATPYHGEDYSLDSWDLYDKLIIGVQGHIINNHHFRDMSFYNTFLPGEYRATVLFDKFGDYIWKQLEKLAKASQRRLEIAITEFDVYTEGFCEDTVCKSGEPCEDTDGAGTIYPSLHSQELLPEPWKGICEQVELIYNGRLYGSKKEIIADKFYEAFYYQAASHPQVTEITSWRTMPDDLTLTSHYRIGGELQTEMLSLLNHTTPSDSASVLKDKFKPKERLKYSHTDFVDEYFRKKNNITVTPVTNTVTLPDSLPFGLYRITFNDGRNFMFDIPIRAGRAFNPDTSFYGRYCEYYDNDTCMVSRVINPSSENFIINASGECPNVCDVNGDGSINILDVIATINCCLTNAGCGCAADVNGDGNINILDVVQLVGIAIGE